MFAHIRPSRDWRWNAGLGFLAVVLGVLFLVRPDFALAVVAGTLGLSSLLTGGTLLRTAWDQRDAELAHQHASARIRYVEDPYGEDLHGRAYRDPAGRTWVHVRRGVF